MRRVGTVKFDLGCYEVLMYILSFGLATLVLLSTSYTFIAYICKPLIEVSIYQYFHDFPPAEHLTCNLVQSAYIAVTYYMCCVSFCCTDGGPHLVRLASCSLSGAHECTPGGRRLADAADIPIPHPLQFLQRPKGLLLVAGLGTVR